MNLKWDLRRDLYETCNITLLDFSDSVNFVISIDVMKQNKMEHVFFLMWKMAAEKGPQCVATLVFTAADSTIIVESNYYCYFCRGLCTEISAAGRSAVDLTLSRSSWKYYC